MSWDLSVIDGPIEIRSFVGLDENGVAIFGDVVAVYCINIAPQVMTPALEPFVVEPAHPKRVFAGDNPDDRTLTVCLTFADEAEAREHLAEWWT